MTKRVIEHEIKLEKSVKIVLAIFSFGVLVHLFAPVLSINEALAELSGGSPGSGAFHVNIVHKIEHSGTISDLYK